MIFSTIVISSVMIYFGLGFPRRRLWDIAQVIPKERISVSESFEGFVKFLRLCMFVSIFILLLACLVVAQGSLLMLEAALVKVSVMSTTRSYSHGRAPDPRLFCFNNYMGIRECFK